MSRKIIYSPAYGSGWTTWAHDYEVQTFMISYPPIVEYLESGGDFKQIEFSKLKYQGPCAGPSDEEMKQLKFPSCLIQFVIECREKFKQVPCLSALRDAKLMEVNGPVRITDHDGYETVEIGNSEWL